MVTPPDVVHRSHLRTDVAMRRDKTTLIRYPSAANASTLRVVVVPALISRPAILDLVPGRSLIEALVDAGFETYLLDWGIPDASSADLSLTTIVTDYLARAVDRVRARGPGPIALLGYCMGGTLACTYAALAGWSAPDLLVTLAAPVDFRYGGLLARWCAADVLDLERVLSLFGNVPAHLIERMFFALRPTAVADARATGRTDAAHGALARWAQTWVDFPGAAAREWVEKYYRANALVSGTLWLGEARVDLHRIRAPLLALAAEHDEIAPLASVSPLADMVGSEDRRLVRFPGGHIALVAGRAAPQRSWPCIIDWLGARSTIASREPVA